jgi:hypothetical protein
MTPDQLLKEWEAADPRDFGQLIRWLTFFARQYEKAKKTAEHRFWILQQLDFLTRLGESLCPNDQLKPVRRLMLALIGLDRGVESPILTPRYWAYPKPIAETLFRARMAAAVQMHHETGKRISPSSVSLVISQAKTPDVGEGSLENWRQAFLRGDPETDIGAFYYHRWTNPKSGIVVGPSESASGTDDPQADIDMAVFDFLHPGERVGWSGGALRTKRQYAEWLARTAGLIRSMG